jgi:hypothetical protein
MEFDRKVPIAAAADVAKRTLRNGESIRTPRGED